MVISAGSSFLFTFTSHHVHGGIQQGRSHIRRNPRRHATIRRNIRPTALQTAPSLTNSRTTPVIVLDAPSLRETPPTNQTTETVKSRIIRLEILLFAQRQASVVPPHAATAILPIVRHVGYLPLIVGNTPRRMLRKVHEYSFGMRRNSLTVHGNRAAHVD